MSQIAKFINHNTARRTFHQTVAIYKSDPCNGDYQRIFVHSRRVSAGLVAWPIRNMNQSFRRDDLSYFNHINTKKMGLIPQSVGAAVSDPRHYKEHSKHIVVRIVSGHVTGTMTSRRSLCHMPSSAWPLSEWRMS